MFVKDYMTRHPIMVEPAKRVIEAQKLMGENNIRHLPVVGDGKRFLGLVTRGRLQIAPDRLGSLNVWEITRYLADLTVEKVMVKKDSVYTIGLEATLEEAAALQNIKILGLMTMPPYFYDPERARPYFAKLRRLAERAGEWGLESVEMGELSMGMSGDYEAAISEGATIVRVGTAIFGERV